MPAGRKPKPTELKVLTGNPGKRRLAASPAGVGGTGRAPTAPAWLPDEAKREWRRVARLLTATRVLAESDLSALALYCEAYARYRAALDEITGKDGKLTLTVDTGTGSIKAHPALTIMNQAQGQMRAILVEFGMTPSSRTRVASDAPREMSEFERYLARKNRQAEGDASAALSMTGGAA
jgi:P27 family predicted phage terminase small subunit